MQRTFCTHKALPILASILHFLSVQGGNLRARRFRANFFLGMIATRVGKVQRVSHKVYLHACARWSRIRHQSDLPSIVYRDRWPARAFLSLRKRANDVAIQRLLRRDTMFRVKSRPDFSCYLFDESWRRFAEFRGNPGCTTVPRRHSARR